jgi:hypothetical protein
MMQPVCQMEKMPENRGKIRGAFVGSCHNRKNFRQKLGRGTLTGTFEAVAG